MSTATIKRVDAREHVLLRPDMYIGSIAPEKTRQWLVNPEGKLYIADAHIVPGLYKIFDEIITNASDNKQRDKERSSNRKMSYIKVSFDKTPKGTQITVINDGVQGFIDFNKEEKMYIPQLAFGILMTSSNYDDTEERVTGGRNGFGAKLTNIYSQQFQVEIVEGGQKYVQTWSNNMMVASEPTITKIANKQQNYISVSFIPDYAKFQLQDIGTDNLAYLSRRAFDIAGCNENLSVYLNGQELGITNFKQYVQMVFQAANPEITQNQIAMNEIVIPGAEETTGTEGTTTTAVKKRGKPKHWTDEFIAYYEPNEYWSIALFGNELKEYQQISFVNSIFTSEGGTHVDHVIDQLLVPINAKVKDYLKKMDMKPNKELNRAQIKNNIFIVVRSLIVNPSFDSQTKTCLRTTKALVKTNCPMKGDDDKQLKDFFKVIGNMPNLMQTLAKLVSSQQEKALAKTDGSKTKNIVVPKLDDAIDAGTQNGHKCFLYLTEGDSAKSMAVEGLSKLPDGRRFNGVFPLRGKVLNVRDADSLKVTNNIEITNLKKILGLKQGADYSEPESRKTLRYGKVVIMTDQDTDGSHIKGLLLNLFDTFWPSLLKAGYIQEFITPIVKVRKNGGRNVDELVFYTLQEFQTWLAEHPNTNQYNIQYYKGLGTSDNKEAKEYFKQIQQNKKQFSYDVQAGGRLNLAFNKKLADKRKEWLRNADPNSFVDNTKNSIQIGEFVDKELVQYELENVKRSIPSMIDGLKPSQRKILFACFKRNLTSPMKVVQLSGYVGEHASYHHGEQSLNSAIVNLAQCFTGANNLPLLVAKGQFGSRPRGGDDSAAPRYINTMLQPITRFIFKEEDDQVLNYLNDDGQLIEPEYYVPIIPMVLVNGATGIGTGWSTNVPQFNPVDLIEAIKKRLLGKSTKSERYGTTQISPWYRGWRGNVEIEFKDINQKFVENWKFQGTFTRKNDKILTITELPPGVWTEDFRDKIMQWTEASKERKEKEKKDGEKVSNRPTLHGVYDYSDNDRVEIQVEFDKTFVLTENCTKKNHPDFKSIISMFNLESSIRISNMMLHDSKNVLQQYKTASHIIDEFFKVRMNFYTLRKQKMIEEYREQTIIATEKARFIKLIIENQLKVQNVTNQDLCNQLWKLQFMPSRHNRIALLAGVADAVDEEIDKQTDDATKKAADELLQKKTKDVYEREQFFSLVKQPVTAILSPIYKYLTSMAISSMTKEKFNALLKEQEATELKLQKLQTQSETDLWLTDLVALEIALGQFENNLANDQPGHTITVKSQDVENQVMELKNKFRLLEDKQNDSDIEPELILKPKTKEDKRPSLLKQKDGEAPKRSKSVKAESKEETGKPKSAKAAKTKEKDEKPKDGKAKDPKAPKEPKEKKPRAPKKKEESTESEPEISLIDDDEISASYEYEEIYEDVQGADDDL